MVITLGVGKIKYSNWEDLVLYLDKMRTQPFQVHGSQRTVICVVIVYASFWRLEPVYSRWLNLTVYMHNYTVNGIPHI